MSLTIGPYTMAKGALLPYEERDTTRQRFDITGDGGVVTHDVGYKEEFVRAIIKCPRDEGRAIAGFLTNGVRFRAMPFILVDGFGRSLTVRFWDKKLYKKYVQGAQVQMDLMFRIEVT